MHLPQIACSLLTLCRPLLSPWQSFTYQMLNGLAWCHSHRIFHRCAAATSQPASQPFELPCLCCVVPCRRAAPRLWKPTRPLCPVDSDLKPQNVLVDPKRGTLKLADFGLARAFTVPLRTYTHEVVTLWYRAPEILLGGKQYSVPVDIWSVGTIIPEMVTGQPLFPGDSEIDELFKIFRLLGTPNENLWQGVQQLPDFKAEFPKWKPRNLREIVQHPERLNDQGLDLIAQMLKYTPNVRRAAMEPGQGRGQAGRSFVGDQTARRRPGTPSFSRSRPHAPRLVAAGAYRGQGCPRAPLLREPRQGHRRHHPAAHLSVAAAERKTSLPQARRGSGPRFAPCRSSVCGSLK